MAVGRERPEDVARRSAERFRRRGPKARSDVGGWRRETWRLPRSEARELARQWFDRFPRAAYATEIEFWRELPDGIIEFTIRRLPTAD